MNLRSFKLIEQFPLRVKEYVICVVDRYRKQIGRMAGSSSIVVMTGLRGDLRPGGSVSNSYIVAWV